jgi:predicted secreted protein
MKKDLTVVLMCLAVLFISCAEDSSPTRSYSPQVTWTSVYGSPSEPEVGNSLQVASDGSFIIAGSARSIDPYGMSGWLVKADSLGNLAWDHIFNEDHDGTFYRVKRANDGGFIYTGMIQPGESEDTDVWLVKTDPLGTVEWSQAFDSTQVDEGYGVVALNQGGYIVAGTVAGGSYDWLEAWMIKTDAQGNMIWNRKFGNQNQPMTFYDVAASADGGYVATGSAAGPLLLMKVDENGDSLWCRTFNEMEYCAGQSLERTSDNGFIIAGYSAVLGYEYQLILIKTDPEGNEIWRITQPGSGSDVEETQDGGYIAVGFQDYTMLVVKTNPTGSILWTMTPENGGCIDRGKSIAQVSENGYVICGYSTYMGQTYGNLKILRLDVE